MAEEDAFENLDGLDWSDVESELKANRDQILSEVKTENSDQKEKKEGEEGESTNAMKQANVIAQEEVVDIKKENEKKRKNALQIQKVIGEGDWIQKATKNMRKDKPCTGEKFGSESCPPGSKRYNLAKTFRKMGPISFISRKHDLFENENSNGESFPQNSLNFFEYTVS